MYLQNLNKKENKGAQDHYLGVLITANLGLDYKWCNSPALHDNEKKKKEKTKVLKDPIVNPNYIP